MRARVQHGEGGYIDLQTLNQAARLGAPRSVPAKMADQARVGAWRANLSRASGGRRADKLLRRFSWEGGE